MADLWFRALSAVQRKAYDATIATSHQSHTHVELWFPDRTLANNLTGDEFAIDGQVDFDGVSRSATSAVADTKDRLKVATNLIFLDRLLRAERHVVVPALDLTVKVPKFTGPIIKADENGGVVSLEAHGMELWLQGQQKTVRKFPKGAQTTDVIAALLRLGGVLPEHMSVPSRPDRLPKSFQVGPQYEGGIWAAVQYLAETINCSAFFDGGGYFELIHRPGSITAEFTGGRTGTVMGQPQRSTLIGGTSGGDGTSVVNDVIVFGQALPVKPPKNPPAGYKPPPLPVIRGEAIAKTGSRFAPRSLGFPDDPDGLFLVERTTLDHCRTNAAAQKIAEERLRRRMSVAAQVTFDSAPVPHLNPYDRIKVSVRGYNGVYYFSKGSMPFNFTESTPQTIGYNALVHVSTPRHKP